MATRYAAIGLTGRGDGETSEFAGVGPTADEARRLASIGTGNPESHFRVVEVTPEQEKSIRIGATPTELGL
jgi:hypothetical protein